MDPKNILLLMLLILAGGFGGYWWMSLTKSTFKEVRPSFYQMLVGFITDFLDTLGVGSFATTTSFYRLGNFLSGKRPEGQEHPFFGRSVDDEKLPGTLNVGHTLPTILQAFIYIQVIEIDLMTLWSLIIASILGSYLGASFVSRLPKPAVQIGMGSALIVAALFLLSGLVGLTPKGGDALGLTGASFLLGLVGNFIFGALMTIGVGAYAPIMVMVSLLGMSSKTAFPLMMGSCAFLMPVASYRFIQTGRYDARAALGLTLLGLPGVAIAAWIVKSLPLDIVKWLVVVVVIYTALAMIIAGRSSGKVNEEEGSPSGRPSKDQRDLSNPYDPPSVN